MGKYDKDQQELGECLTREGKEIGGGEVKIREVSLGTVLLVRIKLESLKDVLAMTPRIYLPLPLQYWDYKHVSPHPRS